MNFKNWNEFFSEEEQKPYYKEILQKVEEEEKTFIVYPKKEDRLNAFKFTDIDDIKVVILGQDPYINENEAMGLSFSVPKDKKIPPSLKNIFKEIESTTNCSPKENGDLTYLTKQGVFLMNCVLTVRKGESASHKNFGYKTFTDNVLKVLNEIDKPIVFMLWGNFAKEKQKLLNNEKHLILTAAHPSPLARNMFSGCNHFNLANEFLEKNNIKPISW